MRCCIRSTEGQFACFLVFSLFDCLLSCHLSGSADAAGGSLACCCLLFVPHCAKPDYEISTMCANLRRTRRCVYCSMHKSNEKFRRQSQDATKVTGSEALNVKTRKIKQCAAINQEHQLLGKAVLMLIPSTPIMQVFCHRRRVLEFRGMPCELHSAVPRFSKKVAKTLHAAPSTPTNENCNLVVYRQAQK
jgi:hypothetical protein